MQRLEQVIWSTLCRFSCALYPMAHSSSTVFGGLSLSQSMEGRPYWSNINSSQNGFLSHLTPHVSDATKLSVLPISMLLKRKLHIFEDEDETNMMSGRGRIPATRG